MLISRRDLLRRLGRGAVVSAAFPWVHEAAWAGTTPVSSAEPDPIRLDSNENAYGPSERAKAAMRESLGVPDRGREAGHALTAEIAALHRVRPEQVVLGCGSVGIMRTAAATFLGPRRKLVLASPTFDPIAEYARSVGADVVTVPLTAQYAHDLDAMLAHLDAAGGLVYICNPNNPTGTLTPRHELETFIRRLPSTARVLIDEAYHHYAGTSSAYASFIDRPVDDRRVIVTRSLSKVHGLSGLRLGYAIAAPEAARRLRAAEPPMDVGAGALRGATEALHDRGHVRLSVQRNANDRQEFYNQANARMLRVIDSHANFVMLNTGGPAEQAIVLSRSSNILSMPKHIRVSLRTPPEMLAFWRVWELMPRQAHTH